MRQAIRTKEDRIIQQLNSRSHSGRCMALRTISERGGPGAVILLSNVLERKSLIKEKIMAARAIGRIANRTRIYYEGITALENASHDDQPASVRSVARHIRERIAGNSIITTCPGCAVDKRILVGRNEKKTPDFLRIQIPEESVPDIRK